MIDFWPAMQPFLKGLGALPNIVGIPKQSSSGCLSKIGGKDFAPLGSTCQVLFNRLYSSVFPDVCIIHNFAPYLQGCSGQIIPYS